MISDACDTTWYRDACQASATQKRSSSDACNAIFNHNFFYVVFLLGCRATVNTIIHHRPFAADGQCAVGGECPGQFAFVPAGYNFVCNFTEIFACQCRAAFKKHLFQNSAVVKHTNSDACDTTWNGDAC